MRPEIEPITGIDGDRHAVQSMERLFAPSLRGAILHIVDDERSGVHDFHELSKFDRWCSNCPAELPGELHELTPKLSPGPRQKFSCGT